MVRRGLTKGDKVLVVLSDFVARVYVEGNPLYGLRWSSRDPNGNVGSGIADRDQENITWARGWDTPDAQALEARVVLERSA